MNQGSTLEEEFSYLIQQSKICKRVIVDAKTSINSVCISEDHKQIVIFHHLNGGGFLSVWDLETLKVKQRIDIPKLYSEDGLCKFSRDNKYIFFALYNDNKLQIIQLVSRRARVTECHLEEALKQMEISINPKYCCTVTSNYCLLWNQDTKKVDHKIKTNLNFICCCFKNNDKQLITISYLEDEYTQFNCWRTNNYKVNKTWACRYVSKQANCFLLEKQQILIVDYYDVQEHYIQIWSLIGYSLIRSLYQAIDPFYIRKIYNSKLIVECQDEDDEEEQNTQHQWIGFFDILTFKYRKFETFIDYGLRYFVLQNALIVENRKKKSNNTEIIINLK
ncbi:unnamed protein product [Paramecium sonneborni]|uniref:Uncharacterized protein n=1 Tax=Paramecium sonneborni TaxID=65129 RepID=A0A8S1N3D0_9CILI|nr:unnamed protein product [Paramecium sonneborni]